MAQRVNGLKSAACQTYHFNQWSETGFNCGLTGECLSESDLELICREHEYPG